MDKKMKKLSFWAATCLGAMVFFAVGTVQAQDLEDAPFECDDKYGECGTPEQSGGGGCGCGGGSILINNTDLGDTYQFADDYDDDGSEDPYDNCPFVSNRHQEETDGDGHGDACDNCPAVPNDDQSDIDGDSIGDACDSDKDDDLVPNEQDLCPDNFDPLQKDTDSDGVGDACDPDIDNDGVANLQDNCPLIPNADQANVDDGNLCDGDDDGDGIRNTLDNCPQIPNEDQKNTDGDEEEEDAKMGDVCDPDIDNDGVNNADDNCPEVPNNQEEDWDRDGKGDVCDDKPYCFIVKGDEENCLDSTQAFTVYTPSLDIDATDESVTLELFANRESAPMKYKWRLNSVPSGSNASIDNPVGAVGESSVYKYIYLEDMRVSFVPDVPGKYEIQVTAELVWEDELYPETSVAQATAIIEVKSGSADSGGCSVTSVGISSKPSSLIPLLLLAAGLILRRRR